MTEEEKQTEFLNQNRLKIIEKALENEHKVGYVQMIADSNLQLIERSLKFIEGKFNSEEYTQIGGKKPLYPEKVVEPFFIYFRVLWFHNKTVWQAKQLLFLEKLDGL